MDAFSMIYFLPLLLMILSMGQVHAYVTQTPEISGLNNRTMKLTGSSGGYSGGTYSRTGTVVINGKTVPIPGSLKPSTGMGAIVKNALKLNPYKIAGTLAAGWLIDQGIQWMEDQQAWVKPGTSQYQQYGTDYGYVSFREDGDGSCNTAKNTPSYWCTAGDGFTNTAYGSEANKTCQYVCVKPGTAPAVAPVPMTDADWNELSDPMPVVGAEAPSAPYLPEGVTIVDPPAYIPQTVTVGSPYTKADGSTAQPMAKISPAGDGQVIIDTYEQPLTNPDGTPVPTGTPINDTKEDPPPPKDPCADNPDRIGCMSAGEDKFVTPKKDIAFTFTPEASPIGSGSCPAPISIFGQSLSYQPACDAMSIIKPLVLAMASMMAAYILLGAFRGGD